MSKPKQNKPLTAHQLAELLLKEPDFPILLASDPEGNNFATIDGFGCGRFKQVSYGYECVENLTQDDLHPKMNCKNVFIVLYPKQ